MAKTPYDIQTTEEYYDFILNPSVKKTESNEQDFREMLQTGQFDFAVIQDCTQCGEFWRYWWQSDDGWHPCVSDWQFPQWAKKLDEIRHGHMYELEGSKFTALRRGSNYHFLFARHVMACNPQ